ncbi:hypothetical protein FKG94_01080 [Exilibacterium tricleocarpae]|uniref:FlgD/Vpr Ig-like domain-containing protein n=1 Tax=Exilibacterium tricleocarpae TaxID=2591008 RepID=A0A545U9N4_9GAMM|nr:FlgD immunoglobulin-like domain containing protein [Exilibacterium tricleocarpae]TQV86178.1 hypothetical protein FKG94_01080 [Exilibacterium tricleocarpae]
MIRLVFSIVFCAVCNAPVCSADTGGGLSLSVGSFNPSTGASVTVTYNVAVPQAVTLRVYDPDQALVRTLLRDVERDQGEHTVSWDGKDDAGTIVPNEAYTFVVEGSKGLLADPWTVSGGVVEDILDAVFDPSDDTVRYDLPQPARVLIRLGVKNGPLYKTLVDWEPRVGGRVTEYWNGRDENQLFDLRAHKDFTALITYVTLPQATVVTFGNKNISYPRYKREVAEGRALKVQRPWRGPAMLLRPANLVPPHWVDAPVPSMKFPDHQEGAPVGERLKVRVDVSDIDRDVLADDQYEIIFYVNDIFFGEAERGHLPFNWVWELHQFPKGRHRLTVNISSAKGMIGVVSRNITVGGKN